MARDARARTERVVMHSSRAPVQKRLNRIAETAELERTFSPSGLPALVQTPRYARALFRADDEVPETEVESATAERISGQEILDSGEHRFGFLMPEGSLGWALLPPADMLVQIEQLIAVADRDNVEVGIIPWGYAAPVLPLNSFTLFDDRLAVVGTTTRVAYLTARTDLDAYKRMYERLVGCAVVGAEARRLLMAVADRYRDL
jgi:hypothetical protein